MPALTAEAQESIKRLHSPRTGLNAPEPAPQPTSEVPVWPQAIATVACVLGDRENVALLIDDMVARDRDGFAKYGVRLQASNGRDHVVDGYQETLDAVVYLKAEVVRLEAIKLEMLTTPKSEQDADFTLRFNDIAEQIDALKPVLTDQIKIAHRVRCFIRLRQKRAQNGVVP